MHRQELETALGCVPAYSAIDVPAEDAVPLLGGVGLDFPPLVIERPLLAVGAAAEIRDRRD